MLYQSIIPFRLRNDTAASSNCAQARRAADGQAPVPAAARTEEAMQPMSRAPVLAAQDGLSAIERAKRNPLMLGLFLPIQKGGWTPSSAPRGTAWDYGYNAGLTVRAEELGFDLVFGLAQWLPKGGHGGVTCYREDSLDPFILTAGLSALTHNIVLISTVHVLYGWHPMHVAKFGATIDHMSGGRWGINVVTGYTPNETAMFGLDPIPHDERYDRASEFVDLMLELWSRRDNLSVDGRYYRMRDAFVTPKPANGRPIVVNASTSDPGYAFAGRHSDLIFITSPAGAELEAALGALPAHNAHVKSFARPHGRELRTIINPMIVCRDSEREVKRTVDAILEGEDPAAVDDLMRTFTKGDTRSWRGHNRTQRIVGGNVQIFGTPEQVADGLIRLHKAGCDGAQISFFDFAVDLEHFAERVLPLLRQAGLRVDPPPALAQAAH